MAKLKKRECGSITKKEIDSQVELSGWIHRRRDHGGVIFLDLRDESGLIQNEIVQLSESAMLMLSVYAWVFVPLNIAA